MPVFLLAALFEGRSWAKTLRVTAIIAAVGAIGVAPWFIYFADETHLVYRVDVSRAWLLPAAALTLVFLVLSLIAVRRGSSLLAVLAGMVFAAGFLV